MIDKKTMLPLELYAYNRYRGALAMARRVRYSTKGPFGLQQAWTVLLSAEQEFDKTMGTVAIEKHTGKDFKFDQWVNVRLTDEHKAELEHLSASVDPEALLDWIAGMTYAGYSFSVAWDDYSDAQQVSLVCKAVKDPNYGLGLSARHPDFDLAMLTLQYKHDAILAGDWGSNAPSPTVDTWG